MQVKGCSYGDVSSEASHVGSAACMSRALRPWLLQFNPRGTLHRLLSFCAEALLCVALHAEGGFELVSKGI